MLLKYDLFLTNAPHEDGEAIYECDEDSTNLRLDREEWEKLDMPDEIEILITPFPGRTRVPDGADSS